MHAPPSLKDVISSILSQGEAGDKTLGFLHVEIPRLKALRIIKGIGHGGGDLRVRRTESESGGGNKWVLVKRVTHCAQSQ